MLESISTNELALVVAIAWVAGFITGLAGFGTGLIAAGLWLHLMPAQHVPPLVAICSVAAQVAGLSAVRSTFRWRPLSPYLIGAVVGVPLGVFALRYGSTNLLRPAVGIFLIAFSIFELTGLRRLEIGAFGGRVADGSIGACGGFFGGFAGLSAPLPVVWLRLRGGTPDAQRAIYQPFNLLVLLAAALVMGIDGHVTQTVLILSAWCLPATMLGAWLGVRCYRRVNQATFRRVVLSLLLVSGLTLMVIW